MNKKTSTFTLKSKTIIETRDSLSKTISSYWKTIETTNLMSKSAVKAGMRKYDLKELYNQITQYAEHRVKAKLLLNAINSGIKKFDAKNITKDHYYKIYTLNELNEQKVHLIILATKHTINPSVKAKVGKKNIGKDEVFTNAKVNALINEINIKIEALKADIEKFNSDAEIEIDGDYTFAKNFTA